jgi:hypothetical protein
MNGKGNFCLDENNFLMYAIKNYDNPECMGLKEFHEDLNRIVYLKRLFRRYHNKKELKEKLILTHLITFYNVFGVEAATKILLYKIEKDLYYILKTFLMYLNYVSLEKISYEENKDFFASLMDPEIIKILRNI